MENKHQLQEFPIFDGHGRKMLALSGTQGKPAILFYNSKGKIAAWITLTADGALDIRDFDETE